MEVLYYTSKSQTHAENQDGVFVQGYDFTHLPKPALMRLPSLNGLFVVLDGLGGAVGGSYATRLLLNMLAAAHMPRRADCETIQGLWHKAARRLFHQAHDYPELQGMGSAVGGLWMRQPDGWIFNSGDCRVYQTSSGHLRLLSHDHSFAQALLDEGIIGHEEARLHPRRNMLFSAISAIPNLPEIYCRQIRVYPGSRFLICSDGLWSLFSKSDLQDALAGPLKQAGGKLVQTALNHQCPDDFSFIIIQC